MELELEPVIDGPELPISIAPLSRPLLLCQEPPTTIKMPHSIELSRTHSATIIGMRVHHPFWYISCPLAGNYIRLDPCVCLPQMVFNIRI